jgi:S1-C subfamily serine protease
LFLGSWLEPHIISLAHSPEGRAALAVIAVLGCALTLMTVGEFIGLHIKHRVMSQRFHKFDNGLGSGLSTLTCLLGVWLLAAGASSLPSPEVRDFVRDSAIVRTLNRALPSAPNVISKLGHIINPNGFPDVFIGDEPLPPAHLNLPALGDLAAAVEADKNAVVRIRGPGCGGIVSGSGFVVKKQLIATNAHVVAGIGQVYVQDSTGTYKASLVWFNPGLDFALLRVTGIATPPLQLTTETAGLGTPAAVLGYPGGGPFTAEPAVVHEAFKAKGRDIYGRAPTLRDVYELQAKIEEGNSGGPLVAKDGKVIGMIFAESTSYKDVGYALTASQIADEINRAGTQTVSSGRCTD